MFAVDLTGTTPQYGLPAEEFERAYSTRAGIAYAYEFLLLLDKIKTLSERLGRSVSILEIGVGTGRAGAFLAGLPWVSSYLGIDTEPTNIIRCRQKHPELNVCEKNFLLINPDERWDAIVVPYTMFPGISAGRQEAMFLKMLHHGNSDGSIILVDTILPDAHGELEDVHFDNDGQELGLSISYHELFRCLATFRQWINTYNQKQKSGKVSHFSHVEYIFAFPDNETQGVVHHMLCCEK